MVLADIALPTNAGVTIGGAIPKSGVLEIGFLFLHITGSSKIHVGEPSGGGDHTFGVVVGGLRSPGAVRRDFVIWCPALVLADRVRLTGALSAAPARANAV